MNTPIFDYVQKYVKSDDVRLHMPGHKGKIHLGCEAADITEIFGADSLYQASGIILESENNASRLFSTGKTLYSTEGSSQCIRAMLYLAIMADKSKGRKPVIVAARNSHKTFIQAAALLDFEIVWLWPENEFFSLCHADISKEQLKSTLARLEYPPAAIYVTSPDYLGGMLDIVGFSQIAHENGIPLIVDNAHGAYRNFLDEKSHPIHEGADMCCDSAHKTLPVLTGGAYLHISKAAPRKFYDYSKRAMSLFGSTSPSYLILQSLDLANSYLADSYTQKLKECVKNINNLKQSLKKLGWNIYDSDELKLTVDCRDFGYTGIEVSQILFNKNIMCEYSDPDYVVLMFTPDNSQNDYIYVLKCFTGIKMKKKILRPKLVMKKPEKIYSAREAILSDSITVEIENAAGRVLAAPSVSCPPAIPIVVSGEIIEKDTIEIFKYYGIKQVEVIL